MSEQKFTSKQHKNTQNSKDNNQGKASRGAGPQMPPTGSEGPEPEGPSEEKVVDSEDYKVK